MNPPAAAGLAVMEDAECNNTCRHSKSYRRPSTRSLAYRLMLCLASCLFSSSVLGKKTLSLNALCGLSGGGRAVTELFVGDYMVLRSESASKWHGGTGSWAAANRTALQRLNSGAACQLQLDSLLPGVDGFLVNVQNNLPISRPTCSAWDQLLRIRSTSQTSSYGCAHFTSSFFKKPIRISFLPVALSQLTAGYLKDSRPFSSAFSITVTSIAVDCDRGEPEQTLSTWTPCPGREELCIQKYLFCDGINHCGLSEDEQHCDDGQSTEAFVISTSTNVTDEGSSWSEEPTAPSPQLAISKVNRSMPAPNTSTEGVAMILGFFAIMFVCIAFFLFLGLCSFGCCAAMCFYRTKRNRSHEEKLEDYLNKYSLDECGEQRQPLLTAAKTSAVHSPPGRRSSAERLRQTVGGIVDLIEPESEDRASALRQCVANNLLRSSHNNHQAQPKRSVVVSPSSSAIDTTGSNRKASRSSAHKLSAHQLSTSHRKASHMQSSTELVCLTRKQCLHIV